MGGFFEIDGVRPVVEPGAFVHPSAVLIGDVLVAGGCYIGPFASLRGDFGRIIVGAGSNIQDSCVLHSFPGRDCRIVASGHIGHGAILHGCELRPGAFVGMNAVVMDGAVIGEEAMVAACAFVRAAFEVPARHLAAGTPAKVKRKMTADEVAMVREGPETYRDLARRSLTSLKPCEPLSRIEVDGPRLPEDIAGGKPLHERRESR